MISLQITFCDGLNPCGLSSLVLKTKVPSKAHCIHHIWKLAGEFCIVFKEQSAGWKLSCNHDV